jgi:hypothetical protein
VTVTREEAEDMSHAHAEGWHGPPDGVPREGCPDCEDRPLRDYPPHNPPRRSHDRSTA